MSKLFQHANQNLEQITKTSLLLLIGTFGSFAMKWVGAPMPFLFGSLLASAIMAIYSVGPLKTKFRFPEKPRRIFIVLIGVMIGSSFTPELTVGLVSIWRSLLAVVGFVLFSHFTNFIICLKIGKYDRLTAFYASTPGGLIESIELGAKAGGDSQIITLQHFSRIILVVTTVPLFLSYWVGQQVGSSAGMTLGAADFDAFEMLIIAAIGFAGYHLGRVLHLPAYFLIGPMIFSAISHGTGMTDAQAPFWMTYIAQVVLGTALGAQFSGLKVDALRKAFWVGLISVGVMLSSGLVLAWGLAKVTVEPVEVLFISLVPGGVVEMSLIALSLGANPIFVTAHHIFRISITVIFLTLKNLVFRNYDK